MRFLFDENLSPRLVSLLSGSYPDSQHVESAGLRGQPDSVIWEYAGRQGLTIVSKDNDFRQVSFLKGSPPKVVWLCVGNAGTMQIARILERRREELDRRWISQDRPPEVVDLLLPSSGRQVIQKGGYPFECGRRKM